MAANRHANIFTALLYTAILMAQASPLANVRLHVLRHSLTSRIKTGGLPRYRRGERSRKSDMVPFGHPKHSKSDVLLPFGRSNCIKSGVFLSFGCPKLVKSAVLLPFERPKHSMSGVLPSFGHPNGIKSGVLLSFECPKHSKSNISIQKRYLKLYASNFPPWQL